jgi:ribosomal subunit interface protein
MNLLLKIENIDEKGKIKALIDSKSKKFKKYLSENSKLTWNYFFENGEYFSEVKVSGFQGQEIKARASSMNQYKVVDIAIEKIGKQLNRRFGQRKAVRSRIDHQSYSELELED